MAGFSRLENGWIIIALPDIGEIFGSLNRLSFFYVLLLIIALAVILLLSLLLARSISRPIIQATQMLRDISEGEGDLTKRIVLPGSGRTESLNEIGQLAQYFNDFVATLNVMIRDLKSVSRSSRGLSDQLASGTAEISSNSHEVSATTESISKRIGMLSGNIEISTTSVKEIKDQIVRVNENIDNETS